MIYHSISIAKSILKICVCSHKYNIQTYRKVYFFCRLGHAPGGGDAGGQKFDFSKHRHDAYQIKWNDE